MLVSEVMQKDVITADKDEKISKVLRKMEENRVHQIPVVSDGELVGMVYLKDLIRFAHDIEKNTAGQFVQKVSKARGSQTLQEAVKSILEMGVRAVPVVDNGKVAGIVSETDLIKNVEFLEEMDPEALVGERVLTVKESDSIGLAMEVMAEHNVSRTPVVDAEDRIVGCIDNIGLIKFLEVPKESVPFSHHTSIEQKSAKKFSVKDYMRGVRTMDVAKFSLREAVEYLQSHEEVVLTKKQHPVGILTPRDILELAVIESEIPVVVARADRLGDFEKSHIDDALRKFVKKFDKIIPIERFFIYVDVHESGGGRKKYSMRSSLSTDGTVFRARSDAWSSSEALQILLDGLEKQVMKEKDRSKKFDKLDRRKSKEASD